MGCRCNKAQTNGDERPNLALDCVCWSVCSLNAALRCFFLPSFLFGHCFSLSNSTWHYSHMERVKSDGSGQTESG